MMVRALCHRIIEVLPRRADEEMLAALVEMFRFYQPSRQEGAPLVAAKSGGRPITKVTRSVRPDVSLAEEG